MGKSMSDSNDSQDGKIDVSSLFSLAGKTALVTGGSSGLGLMMAEGLLQSGVKVIIASSVALRLKYRSPMVTSPQCTIGGVHRRPGS